MIKSEGNMKYKGKDIGNTPEIQMLYEYAERMGFNLDIEGIYKKYSDRNWLTKKGTPIVSVETIMNVENGIAVDREIKGGVKASKKKIRFLPDPPQKDKTKSPKENYNIFLQSDYWKKVRQIKIEQTGRKCQICGSRKELSVHHNSYAHHYQEHKHLEDLVVLCRNCHKKFHNITN